jgi:ribosomal protein S18 acetylase RimI-like enzyme
MMDDDQVGLVSIRECATHDVGLLERYMPTGGTEAHAEFLREQQAGRCTYLIAWLTGVPVASCVVRWNGCYAPKVRQAFPACIEINNLNVREDVRGRGIGTQLIVAAETRVRSRGMTVGIGVGDDNVRARSLYARLGYADTGVRYETTYCYRDDPDVVQRITDHNVFLIKHLY